MYNVHILHVPAFVHLSDLHSFKIPLGIESAQLNGVETNLRDDKP